MISAPFAPRSARRARRCGNCRALAIERRGDWVAIEVTANAFLHHMVRNIVGAAAGDGPAARAARAGAAQLESRQRSQGEATAAALGLYLWRVEYPPQFGLPRPIRL